MKVSVWSEHKVLLIKYLIYVILLFDILSTKASTIQLSDLNSLSYVNGNKCEVVSITQHCPELKYNQTMVSNFAHLNINDSTDMINKLQPVFEVSPTLCSQKIKFLICSSLFPWCSNEISRPVQACRNVCERVKTECANDPIIEHWPSFLDCNQLPEPEKQELCMTMPDEVMVQATPTNSGSKVRLPINGNDQVNHKKFLFNSQPQSTFWKKLTQSQLNYDKVATLLTCPQNFTLNEGGNCVFKCGTDAFYTMHQKKIIETCILVFSVLCFIFTLFSLITFWTESSRFKFPERPVLFLTLCYNLLSISFLLKIFYQKSITTTQLDALNEFSGISSIKKSDISMDQCQINPQCLAYFIIINYLTISASFWWMLFGLSWWLSTAKQWSTEALERKSGVFHVLAWLLPLASPIAALLFGSIKKTELTGNCTAFGFTELPTLFLLVVGAVFIVLSAQSLRSLRTSYKNNKFSQVMSRLLLFGTIFAVPAITATVLMFSDYNHEFQSCLPGEICPQPKKKTLNITVIRYACQVLAGGISGLWVWSKKTCLSCQQKISTVQYDLPSPQTTIENINGTTNHYTYKCVRPLHKRLLNNNYSNYHRKKIISGVHRDKFANTFA